MTWDEVNNAQTVAQPGSGGGEGVINPKILAFKNVLDLISKQGG